MSRQRRMDAIARRRAFIDSQLQLLSSNEARIPNIIRSRTTGSKPRPRYHFTTPSYQLHQHQVMEVEGVEGINPSVYMLPPGDPVSSNDNSPGGAGASPHHQVHQEEVVCGTGGGGTGHDDPGGGGNQMYLTVVNEDTGTGSESVATGSSHSHYDGGGGVGAITAGETKGEEEAVPIAISNADIAKMLSSNEELMKSLQTIQTDDGTVMVVLEGGDFGEGMGRQLTDEDLASSFGYSEEGPNDNTNVDELPEFGESTPLVPSPSAYYPEESGQDQVPEAEETHTQPQHVYIDGDKEPYVLVQTSEGNVLIPSSMVTQSQPQEVEMETARAGAAAPRSGGGIVEFVAAEGGAIEQLIRKRSATPKPVTKKKKPNPTRKLGQGQALHGSRKSAASTSSYLSFNRTSQSQTVVTTSHSRTLPFAGKGREGLVVHNKANGSVILTSANQGQEKPRPFRFELPEIDSNMNDLNENFMSVPIPITIDSLRSETGSRNDEEEIEEFESFSTPSGTQNNPSNNTTNGVTQCSEKKPVLSEFQGVSQILQFKCMPCSKVFNKESDLHLHSQQSHPEARDHEVSISSNAGVATSSHSEESQIKLTRNQLILNENVYTIESSSNQGDDDTVYIQFVDADEDDEPISKKTKIGPTDLNQTGEEDETVLLSVFDETAQGVGRRTLNKASAKANMFSEILQAGGGAWECPSEEENGKHKIQKNVILGFADDGQPITIQSARIRARNDRAKALDQNETNEDEIGDNFQKIFLQVCSETRC